ncbi:TPR-like protein [Rhizophagus irregularis]|uniref:TPR-like protein n=3 Tax=Rhizophagus irregularis TaxID=588596 RepID=A0A2N0Q7F8_9GLOM|nr:hypothetical protein GLOIN_2v1834548 [Rhizophagus irregularis DAOM 181602=DAOM 197198]EXX75850.1 Ski3p [Rhizophagus irregularis DAOM 197198w]PKC14979.1 TPR-like protein [Rhizophagus irregularis]POG82169.1 hypothetical protein GLOIN_2v1834548 [Rhizophagus irregularis DAOM 181602=DAOM 197198]UZO22983.1 hypothetical protein OCT59_015329 [Rhizophagus irregularis]CAB4463214.1 unnamed protein product [Rhizophagus irregularis]|eukprot:XP_025189035.1 hypothetical protein GLOIN_2v1834548 [Rhizophagus irregularis DAOM 181602=DAOM 197198]
MSYIKATLKSAKEAITAKKWEDAIKECEKVLQYENNNYNAFVFLGVAKSNLTRISESEQAYLRAIDIEYSNPLAWQGLAKLYETQNNWPKLADTYQEILIREKEPKKILDNINKLVNLYTEKLKDRKLLISVLKYLLPESSYYDTIKHLDDFPKPTRTLLKIIELIDKDESETIKSEVETRRKRINAGSSASEIKTRVLKEVYAYSELEIYYDKLFELNDKSNDPNVDVNTLSVNYIKYLQKKIIAVSDKQKLLEKLYKKSQQLIDLESTTPTPYEIIIESTDASSADEYDLTLLKKYSEKFPDTGISKMIQGYFKYLQQELSEALSLYSEGFEISTSSLFGHLSLGWIYHDAKDYDQALDIARNGRDIVLKYDKRFGRMLNRVLLSLELCIADCYLNIDVKYHTDALSLYQKILSDDENNILALQGVGIILSSQKQYNKAIEIFEKILKLDPSNHIAVNEIGWIEFLRENYEEAIKLILEAIKMCNDNALYYYRLGRIYWAMSGDDYSDKKIAYAEFIRSAKLDQGLAGPFTYLGHYYRLVDKDHVRAKKCYQKAFSNDSLDEEAGSQLSEYYQSDGEVQLAEGVYRAAIQASFKAGWAWKRLGFSELANGNYSNAIINFQTALRTNSKDIDCWEGLAQAYRNEGKYMASMKAFLRVTELDPSSVYAHYQIATVKQKLGIYVEAIEQYKLTLEKAQIKGEENHIPSLKGLGDCYLALTMEYYQSGYYGSAVESLGHGLSITLRAIRANSKVQCLWKLVGDLCVTAPLLPNYLNLVSMEPIVNLVEIARQVDLDLKLHLPKDIDSLGIKLITDSDFSNFRNADLLVIILTCGCLAYKYTIVLSGNQSNTAPALWYDLGVNYYHLYQYLSSDGNDVENNHEYISSLLTVAIRNIKIALKFEPTNHNYWNALGVMTFIEDAKISQHAFIKAMDYSPKNPVLWTNLGLLYLLHSDLELSNQAFSKAQSLDPDYVPAWVGQAYVANLWGSNEAVGLFEHSYEISGGGYILEADYGFASQAFIRFKKSSKLRRSSLLSPAFALLKLTEQKPDDAASLNLLGLLYEWLNQPDKAADAFKGAILALEKLIQRDEQKSLVDEDQVPNFRKLAYVQGNLGRVLCEIHDFSGSISAYNTALSLIEQDNPNVTGVFKIYSILGAGMAYYFDNQLENSLQMFETALNETDNAEQANTEAGINEVRKDVVVLLSQVLWALGGVEQRNLAKEELFKCIAQNPNYLPAIFGLCAMGLLQDDDTLSTAALREMVKLPIKLIDKLDKEHDIDFLTSRYFLLQNSPENATDTLTKAVHLKPFDLIGWTRLAEHLTSIASPFTSVSTSSTAFALITNPLSNASKNLSTIEKAKVYRTYVTALLITREHLRDEIIANEENQNENNEKAEKIKVEKMKLCEKFRLQALHIIQEAIRIAPWDAVGWSLLKVARRE